MFQCNGYSRNTVDTGLVCNILQSILCYISKAKSHNDDHRMASSNWYISIYVFFSFLIWCIDVLYFCPWCTITVSRLFQLTKETTVQATGVASNLVEAIQGAGLKLQTLSLSFDDFDEAKSGVGGGVQPSEWANLCCHVLCQIHITRSHSLMVPSDFV